MAGNAQDEKPRSSGATRMAELGHTRVGVWLSAEELELVQAAAERAGMPLATWIRTLAYEAAQVSDQEARRAAAAQAARRKNARGEFS